jgi:hypothetical protein
VRSITVLAPPLGRAPASKIAATSESKNEISAESLIAALPTRAALAIATGPDFLRTSKINRESGILTLI